MRRVIASGLWTLLFFAGSAIADLKVMVAVDPSDRESMVISVLDMQQMLSKVSGQPVHAVKSQDLGDVMRTTRTGEYDVYIAPAHVAASALAHGYTLIGSTDRDELYQLVARPGAKAPADLSGGKIYLTQQDSVAAYMARGMLNESGQSLKMFQQVFYRTSSGAGLFAIDAGLVDATVAKKVDYENWVKQNSSKSLVLLSSRAVPGGMSVVVKNSLPEATRSKLESWLMSPGGTLSGIGKVSYHSELANYKYVAALGNWTPSQLPGATMVTASEAVGLQQKGVPIIDVRLAKEYHEKHIRGAQSIPYGEKSLKDVAFDPALDDWAGPEKLDKTKPVIFHCNGAECWKSYKAAKVALSKGFTTVYWFRGGFPEWESSGLAVESSPVTTADAAKLAAAPTVTASAPVKSR
ncbi:MAG TPA: rhodanese-like domain-containing protein [Casimicrobiaceae bacterium]|nr:rhodanese-like domain-containing protein [Casimicrobiaceae bacterium]